MERPSAESLLAELGLEARLTVYLGGAPGAGKTRRLLTEALAQARGGRRVAIGWVETKGRPDLDELAARLPAIAPRQFGAFADFDLEAALASDYESFVLDELAHSNPQGAPNAKRWQDALALRAAGRSVLGAFNVQHLETVAPVAERITGHPIAEIVPRSFLRDADTVIALDVTPAVIESRLRDGRIVRSEDIERAAAGLFKPQNLQLLRELLLRTVDDLIDPVIAPARASNALVLVPHGVPARSYLQRVAAFADALDLSLEAAPLDGVDAVAFRDAAFAVDAVRTAVPEHIERGDLRSVRAALVVVPPGNIAARVLAAPLDRDVYVADPLRPPVPHDLDAVRGLYGHVAGDRMRIGYGKLTIYLGSVAGSGKTYMMLDRAAQLQAEGVDVVAALIVTHGRADTVAKLEGLEVLASLPNGELDREMLLRRRPNVALIDELAHTNAAGSSFAKRYDDVVSVLRAGIDVHTTLNVQHLEGLGDTVERLTGTRVRETVPDGILELAEDVVFVDVAPEVLRQRLRAGNIYRADRVDAALAGFFKIENLTALRELAVREVIRARSERRRGRPFERIVLGIAAREREVALIERIGRLARRLDVDYRVVHVARENESTQSPALDLLARAAKTAHGTFLADRAADPAARLVAIVGPADVLAIESPRRGRRLFGRASFAARLERAGARDVIVLAPRD